jgi:hypothetical protein
MLVSFLYKNIYASAILLLVNVGNEECDGGGRLQRLNVYKFDEGLIVC